MICFAELIRYKRLFFIFTSWFLILNGSFRSFAQSISSMSMFFDGDIRYRFEKWNNMNALNYGSNPEIGKPDDNILLQRIIAGTSIHFKHSVTVSAHLQDSRAFGWSLRNAEEPDAFKIHPENRMEPYYIMNPQEEFFEIYDASIKIDSILNIFSLIAGRQKIVYGDYRIFGPGTWGNTGRWTWDAVRLIIDREKWSAGIWFGGTKIHDPERTYIPFTHTEYTGGGIHSNIRLTDYLNTDIYVAHKQEGSADYIRDKNINRNWIGFRVYNPENLEWNYETSYTYEFGKENNSGISASGLFFKLGYHFTEIAWKPCLTFRYTCASGNNPETARNESFDPVYGAGDRYYGWMNIVKWTNLDDREMMIELYPLKGMRIEMKYNIFNIPRPEGVKINGNMELVPGEKHLGDEVDLFAKYDLNEHWQFVTALGYFILKDVRTEDTINPGNAFWISFQVLYNFKIKLI